MKKIVLLTALLVAVSLSAQAQINVRAIKRGAEASKVVHQMNELRKITPLSRKRIARRTCIVPNKQVGREALRGPSVVGTAQHLRFENVVDKTKLLGSTIGRQLAKKIVHPQAMPPASFAGYSRNFPVDWRNFKHKYHSQGKHLCVLLETAYGNGERFQGDFVRTFNELRELAALSVKEPVKASEALQHALIQSRTLGSGFLVIRVAGNELRPQDALVLDLQNDNFISFNKSMGNAWAEDVQERQANAPTK
ncbi:MAG: hypothetical protein J6X06_00305 [Elusimicrobiaceae bacterium]|nr:hypothetical protein [Elusimicrobiaceae bacterium]